MEPDQIVSSEVLKVVINGSSDSRDVMVSHFLLRKHPDRQFHICLCQYLLYQPMGSVGCPPLPGLGRGGLLCQPVSAGLLPRSLPRELLHEAGGCSLCFCSFPIFHVPLRFHLMLLSGKYLWQSVMEGSLCYIRGSGGFMRTIFFLLFLYYLFYFFYKRKER